MQYFCNTHFKIPRESFRTLLTNIFIEGDIETAVCSKEGANNELLLVLCRKFNIQENQEMDIENSRHAYFH